MWAKLCVCFRFKMYIYPFLRVAYPTHIRGKIHFAIVFTKDYGPSVAAIVCVLICVSKPTIYAHSLNIHKELKSLRIELNIRRAPRHHHTTKQCANYLYTLLTDSRVSAPRAHITIYHNHARTHTHTRICTHIRATRTAYHLTYARITRTINAADDKPIYIYTNIHSRRNATNKTKNI